MKKRLICWFYFLGSGYSRLCAGLERCCSSAWFSLSEISRLCAGPIAFSLRLMFSCACQKRTRKAPAISTRWIHEKGAARPFQTPKELSKHKNASRFAKRIFLCFSHLRLRRRFHLSAGRYRQQRGNTRCEAASRRNEKKAFSAAASFFPFRPLLRGLKGASSPFLVDPARRNRWCFSGSLLARKRELSPA